MFLPALIERIANRKAVELSGENGGHFNPVNISDVVDFLVGSIEIKGSQQVDLAGSDILSLRQIADTIGEFLGVEPVFRQKGRESVDYLGDSCYLEEFLERPLTCFKEGIADLIQNPDQSGVK